MAVEAGGRRCASAQQQRQLRQQLGFRQRVAGAQAEQQRLAVELGVRVGTALAQTCGMVSDGWPV